MVLFAAAFFLMCRLPSASVLMGQDAVMTKPASINPLVQRVPRAGGLVGEHQRHDALGLQHPAALGEDGCHALLVVSSGERLCALLAP